MASYKELQAQLDKLHQQAEAARLKEVTAVIQQIHNVMAEYGLSPDELGFGKRKVRRAIAKYQDPQTGLTWSGKGRAPAWIAGQDRSKFAV